MSFTTRRKPKRIGNTTNLDPVYSGEALTPEVHDILAQCPRGDYQYNLLMQAWETWSGSSIMGKAANWTTRYAVSRRNLLKRIRSKLQVFGWSAETFLIRGDGGGPYRRELLIIAPDGSLFDWATVPRR